MNFRIFFLYIFFYSLHSLSLYSQSLPPTIKWDKNYGGDQIEYLSQSYLTSDNNIVSIGTTRSSNSGTVGANKGSKDVYITKTDINGNLVWSKNYGGTSEDFGYNITETGNGNYVMISKTLSSDGDLTGVNNIRGGYDIWVSEINKTNGSIIWSKRFGGNSEDIPYGIDIATNGDILITGSTRGPANNGDIDANHHMHTRDLYVLRLSSTGNIRFSRSYGSNREDQGRSILSTADGGCIITATTGGVNGDVHNTPGFATGGISGWLVKLDNNGNIDWETTIGGSAVDQSVSVCNAYGGGYLVLNYTGTINTGWLASTTSRGQEDLLLTRLNSQGGLIWKKRIGGNFSDGYSLYLKPQGNITQDNNGYVLTAPSKSSQSGEFSRPNKTNSGGVNEDVWVVKIDTVGNIIWEKNYGGAFRDYAQNIYPLSNNQGYIFGASSSSVSATNSDITGPRQGIFDYWVVRLCPTLEDSIRDTVCAGKDITVLGKTFTNVIADFSYKDTLQSQLSCDSVVTANITVIPPSKDSITTDVCNGKSTTLPGNRLITNIKKSFVDTVTVTSVLNGCDSIFYTKINVLPVIMTSINDSACEGSNYTTSTGKNISNFTKDTIIKDTIKSKITGCDSILDINVKLIKKDYDTNKITVCEGISYTFPSGKRINNISINTSDVFTTNSSKGCDSTIVTELTVLKKSLTDFNDTICYGSDYTFPDNTTFKNIINNTSRDFLHKNTNNCDSIYTVNLIVIPQKYDTINRNICFGDDFTFNSGKRVNNVTSNIFDTNHVNSTTTKCKTIEFTFLNVLPVKYDTVKRNICENSDYTIRPGKVLRIKFNTSDTAVYKASNGCDSIVVHQITVLPITYGTKNTNICQGNNYTFPASGRTVNNLITNISDVAKLTNTNGCDSIFTENLIVIPKEYDTVTANICQGESFTFNSGRKVSNVRRNISDTNQIFNTSTNCFKIEITNLLIKPEISTTLKRTACEGTTFTFNSGRQITASVNTIDTSLFKANNGCDSTVVTELTVLKKSLTDFNDTICYGSDYTFPDNTTFKNIINNTSRDFLHKNTNNCDSIYTVNLIVIPQKYDTINRNICFGDDFTFNSGKRVNNVTSNIFDTNHVNSTTTKCKTIEFTFLNVLPVKYDTVKRNICENSDYTIRPGKVLRIKFNTSDTAVYKASNGCDSIVVHQITVLPITYGTKNTNICQGNNYTFPASGRTVNNLITNISDVAKLTNTNGCDSIFTENLIVIPKEYDTVTANICQGESFTFNSGRKVSNVRRNISDTNQIFNTSTNCFKIEITNLLIKPEISTTLKRTACEGTTFTFNSGRQITASVNTIDTSLFKANNGCDSTVVTELTVLKKSLTDFNDTICYGSDYTFPDNTTLKNIINNTSRDFLHKNTNNCDSIYTVNLIVIPQKYDTINRNICFGDDFTFNSGKRVNNVTSNIFDTNHVNSTTTKCKTIEFTFLNVLPVKYDTVKRNICENSDYTIRPGKVLRIKFNTSDTAVYKASNGCDSIVVHQITVLPITYGTKNTNICQGNNYTFPASGRTVNNLITNISDVAQLTNTNGCDSIFTENLIVIPKEYDTITANICQGESFTFNSGRKVSNVRRNISDTNQIFNTSTNCFKIEITNLLVKPEISTTLKRTACEGTIFTFNSGRQIIASVNTIDTSLFKANNGCDSTVITELTVLKKSLTAFNDTICYGSDYTFPDNTTLKNIINNTSRDFLHKNTNNCDSIYTVNLIVIPQKYDTINRNICFGDDFTFNSGKRVNNVTSNIFDTNHVSSTTTKCKTIEFTFLNVLPVKYDTVKRNICEGELLTLPNGRIVRPTTSYTDTTRLTAKNGCDSIVIVRITVNPKKNTSKDTLICQGSNITTPSGRIINNILINIKDTTLKKTSFGCDSVYTLNINVIPKRNDTNYENVCFGKSFTLPNGIIINNITAKRSDTTHFLDNTTGCQAIRHILINVSPISYDTNTIDICEGESYTFPKSGRKINNITIDDFEVDSFFTNSKTRCDSFYITKLRVIPKSYSYDTVNVCFNENYNSGSRKIFKNVLISFFDTVNYKNNRGCDSIHTTFIKVIPQDYDTLNFNICSGNKFTFKSGKVVNNAVINTYDTNHIYKPMSNCKTIEYSFLNVLPIKYDTTNSFNCEGRTFHFPSGRSLINLTHDFIDTFLIKNGALNGCDSIHITKIKVIKNVYDTVNHTICFGEKFTTPKGKIMPVSVVNFSLVDTFPSGGGSRICDSIVVHNINVLPISSDTIKDTICEGNSYTFLSGRKYNNVFTDIVDTILRKNSFNCDSIHFTLLTVNKKDFIYKYDTICEGTNYTFSDGNTLKIVSPYTYIVQSKNKNKCDSNYITVLQIKKQKHDTIRAEVCYGSDYTLPNGNIIRSVTTSFTDIYTTQGVNNCDSSVFSIVTVNQKDTTIINSRVCKGSNYTIPCGNTLMNIQNDVRDVCLLKNMKNCDSLVITILKVDTSKITTQNDSICYNNSYTFPSGKIINKVTSNTTDTNKVNSTAGCDSTHITFLYVKNLSDTTVIDSLCPMSSYNFVWGGIRTNINNDFTDTHVIKNSVGCDSTIYSFIYVRKKIERDTVRDTICYLASYTFPNGRTINRITNNLFDTYQRTDKHSCRAFTYTYVFVRPYVTSQQSIDVCRGSNFTLRPGVTIRNIQNNYSDTFNTVSTKGCDTTHITNLFVKDPVSSTFFYNIQESNDISLIPNRVFKNVKKSFTDTFRINQSVGCDSLIISIVNVDKFKDTCVAYIPNAFTPNSDLKNDVFVIKGRCIISLDLKIFDQSGVLVFESNNKDIYWDGTDKNGNELPINVYGFKAIIRFSNGTETKEYGYISLIR